MGYNILVNLLILSFFLWLLISFLCPYPLNYLNATTVVWILFFTPCLKVCFNGSALLKGSGKCFEMFLSLARRFDVTESMLCTIAMQLLTGTLGPWVWNYTVKPPLNATWQAMAWTKQRQHLCHAHSNWYTKSIFRRVFHKCLNTWGKDVCKIRMSSKNPIEPERILFLKHHVLLENQAKT